MQALEKGQVLILEDRQRQKTHYIVETLHIVEQPHLALPVQESPGSSILILTTCYPFDSWQTGSAQRYVVVARQGSEFY